MTTHHYLNIQDCPTCGEQTEITDSEGWLYLACRTCYDKARISCCICGVHSSEKPLYDRTRYPQYEYAGEAIPVPVSVCEDCREEYDSRDFG